MINLDAYKNLIVKTFLNRQNKESLQGLNDKTCSPMALFSFGEGLSKLNKEERPMCPLLLSYKKYLFEKESRILLDFAKNYEFCVVKQNNFQNGEFLYIESVEKTFDGRPFEALLISGGEDEYARITTDEIGNMSIIYDSIDESFLRKFQRILKEKNYTLYPSQMVVKYPKTFDDVRISVERINKNDKFYTQTTPHTKILQMKEMKSQNPFIDYGLYLYNKQKPSKDYNIPSHNINVAIPKNKYEDITQKGQDMGMSR